MDREDAQALRHWEERKEELRAELVDKRRLAHDPSLMGSLWS